MNLDLLIKAYPCGIEKEVRDVLSTIDLNAEIDPFSSFDVIYKNETLVIPYRIYSNETAVYANHNFNSVQNDILHCLFSRHHNGYIRQKCLEHIIVSGNAWVAPFVIQLLGEYVIEILYVINEQLVNIDGDIYRNFLKENLNFYELSQLLPAEAGSFGVLVGFD